MGTNTLSLDDLEQAINSVKGELFGLIESLNNSPYEHPSDQIEDAKAVGELAEKWEDLRRARSAMRDVQADRLPKPNNENVK
jgi:hypothetical protein